MSLTKGQKSVLITGYAPHVLSIAAVAQTIGLHRIFTLTTALQLFPWRDWACSGERVPFEGYSLSSLQTWDVGMTVDRLACHSDSAQQDDDYRSRGIGMFDCESGGYESREY